MKFNQICVFALIKSLKVFVVFSVASNIYMKILLTEGLGFTWPQCPTVCLQLFEMLLTNISIDIVCNAPHNLQMALNLSRPAFNPST